MQPGSCIKARYEIHSQLGSGGMGTVYRAHDLAMNRDVAIKVFRESMTAEALQRAQREAMTLAKVRHPNLVGVHSFETDEKSNPMLVFDLLAGQSLGDLLKARKLTEGEVARLFSELCAGLEELHKNGIIHRDIKPSNLIISENEDKTLHLTIIDFGLAKSTEQTSQKLTATGTVLGTPTYMSPEQFRAEKLSTQSDLYSAACVLYEMIAGRPPFDSDSPYAVAAAHLSDPVPVLANAPQLDPFFQKAMAKEAGQRYASALDMMDAFKNPSSATPIARKTIKRTKKVSKTVIFVALVAFFAIFIFMTFTTLTKTSRLTAERIDVEEEAGEAVLKSDRHYPEQYTEALTIDLVAIKRLENLPGAGRKMARLYDDLACHASQPPKKSSIQPDLDAALTAVQKAIELQGRFNETPEDNEALANYYMHRGGIFRNMHRYDEALDSMRITCKLRGSQFKDLICDERMAYEDIAKHLGLSP